MIDIQGKIFHPLNLIGEHACRHNFYSRSYAHESVHLWRLSSVCLSNLVGMKTELFQSISPLRSANFPLFAAFSGWTNSVLSGRHRRLMTAEAKSRTIARTQNLKQHPVNWNKPEINKLNHNLWNPAKLGAYVKGTRSLLRTSPFSSNCDRRSRSCALCKIGISIELPGSDFAGLQNYFELIDVAVRLAFWSKSPGTH